MEKSRILSIGKKQILLENLDALITPAKQKAGIPIKAMPVDCKGPFDGKINSIYRLIYEKNEKKDQVTLIFRARISEAFRYEAIVKEKILFPILDGSINLRDTTSIGGSIKRILQARTGSHVFESRKPPVVPVQDLYYYDETCKKIPYIYTVMNFLPGISLYEYIETQNVKNKDIKKIDANVATVLKNAFMDAGEAMALLHGIQFPAFYSVITDIGDKARAVNWKVLFSSRVNNLIKEAARWPAIRPFLPEVKKYFDTNLELILEQDTPVFFHNDFQPQNFIIDDAAGRIIGYIDFDNWQVGVREQEFVKMQYWGLRELDPTFNQAFIKGYVKHFPISDEFLKRVDVYKAQWFLLVYNFEMDKVARNEQNITVDKRFPAAEKYIEEIQKITRK